MKYKVIGEFEIKDSKVLILDKPRNIVDYDTSKIIVEGKSISYFLTHNENWIVINEKSTLIGKEIEFV